MSPSTTTQPYRPGRDHRFEYAGDAIEAIEARNCTKGCTAPDPGSIKEFGPGGNCRMLAAVASGDGAPIPELQDNGTTIHCTARRPLPPPPPPQTESLFDEAPR